MTRHLTRALTVALSTFAVIGSARAIEPLAPEAQAIFLGSPADKPAKLLFGVTASQNGRHYVTGNEWNLHLFYPSVKDLGGGYVGVGSDQAYLFIGWQKPEVAWLIDYDPLIVDIHKIYQAFILFADTPEAFRALWEIGAKDDAAKAFEALYPDARERERLTQSLRVYRKKIMIRLDRVKQVLVDAAVPSFLNDADTYTWVRDFIRSGRARAMVGDLLARKGVNGISDAARALQVPIRVFYVSNAEEYWDYTKQYRKNMAGIFGDDKSLFVRTLLTWERNRDYRYNVQPLANFQEWIVLPWVVRLTSIVHYRHDTSKDVEFFVTTNLPDDAAKRRAEAANPPAPPGGSQ
ncbi:MAG: hypothetical protein U1F43_15625 [Myxococcota bacterium]